MAAIKSTDPVKKILMSAFKERFDCDKVTNMTSKQVGVSTWTVKADCHVHAGNKKYTPLGSKYLRLSQMDDGKFIVSEFQ